MSFANGWRGTVEHMQRTHACNCIGPQNGDPVCPCRMPAHNRQLAGERSLQFLEFLFRINQKPRIRVKAGSRTI